MKAIRFYDVGDLRLEDVPSPTQQEEMVLLRIASVSLCGSDIHYYKEGGTGSLRLDHPLILGHEFSAWIESGPNKGKLAAVEPAISCGKCEFCLEGNPNLCENILFAGAENTDGALQEYLVWPEHNVFPVPPHVSPQEAAFLEPLGVAIHALNLGKIRPGMDVGVIGTGPIGLMTIQLAKLAGAARIFATDRLGHRLEFAQESGATDLYLADGNEHSQILTATRGRGLDVVFEAAGDDGSAVETAVQVAKRGAAIILVGIPSKDETTFTASTARRKGLTFKVSRRMKNTYPTAIRLLTHHMVNLDSLITHQFPMESYQKAFEVAASRQGIKVFINFANEYGN
ncbi:MAG: zinc-dependent alcohol dehydrogenase [Brevefilum sp.]|jgi:L-iditol 2-dehydrogenase